MQADDTQSFSDEESEWNKNKKYVWVVSMSMEDRKSYVCDGFRVQGGYTVKCLQWVSMGVSRWSTGSDGDLLLLYILFKCVHLENKKMEYIALNCN